MAAKKKEKVEIVKIEECPAWMLTFGDCMSLLLCFFVMLMTFSSIDSERLQAAFKPMDGATSPIEPPAVEPDRLNLERPDGVESSTGEVKKGIKEELRTELENLSPIKLDEVRIKNRYASFQDALAAIGFRNRVTTRQLQEGMATSVDFNFLFKPGSDELNPGTAKWFEGLAGIVNSVGNELRLVANFNPDSVPEQEGGVSAAKSWELYRKRLNVLFFYFTRRYMVSSGKISFAYKIVPKGSKPVLDIVVMDRINTFEVPFKEIIKTGGI